MPLPTQPLEQAIKGWHASHERQVDGLLAKIAALETELRVRDKVRQVPHVRDKVRLRQYVYFCTSKARKLRTSSPPWPALAKNAALEAELRVSPVRDKVRMLTYADIC